MRKGGMSIAMSQVPVVAGRSGTSCLLCPPGGRTGRIPSASEDVGPERHQVLQRMRQRRGGAGVAEGAPAPGHPATAEDEEREPGADDPDRREQAMEKPPEHA